MSKPLKDTDTMQATTLGFYEALNVNDFQIKFIENTPCVLRASKYGTNVHVDFADMTDEFKTLEPYQLLAKLEINEAVVTTVKDPDQIIVIGHFG